MTPTFVEVLDKVMTQRMREMFGGWLPGRIESYDADTNKASVQLLILDEYDDEEGERQTEPYPVITDIPVSWPCIGGKFAFRVDLAKGDECMVMFAARSVSRFYQTGGMVDPEDDRHHDINDACVWPCRLSNGGSDATAMIEITSSVVRIGGNQPLVTKEEFETHIHVTPSGNSDTPLDPISGTAKLRG